MALTGNARMQISQNPWKKRTVPPSTYVFFTQSHGPLYSGSASLSEMIFDFITSNGITNTQLTTPEYKPNDYQKRIIIEIKNYLYQHIFRWLVKMFLKYYQ